MFGSFEPEHGGSSHPVLLGVCASSSLFLLVVPNGRLCGIILASQLFGNVEGQGSRVLQNRCAIFQSGLLNYLLDRKAGRCSTN
jgi:hypothetical protein